MQDFLEKKDIIAVIGVSRNSSKYGYKVFFDLLKNGYDAYAIHPKKGLVGKYIRYARISDLPKRPTLVVMTVKPEVVEKILEECKNIGVKKVWLQPGSESQSALDFCHQNKIEVVAKACIILKSKMN